MYNKQSKILFFEGRLKVPCTLRFSGGSKLTLTKHLKLKNEQIKKSDTSCDGAEKDKVQAYLMIA